MKPTTAKLKITMSYAIKNERQTNMFTGKTSNIIVPKGEVHIFQIVQFQDEFGESMTAPSRYSFCGKTRQELGEQTKDSDKRPPELPVCPGCEIAWKLHPDSPWRAWQENQKGSEQ